ncbi:DUF969 domain-containing protein [Selenomonas sp. oral taxon 136]|uniref:DUF969 domain-containing protein n=1 Tax=Selenomonas sp. oral taxon 136 TaxID=713030 RepID=UPI00076838C6|nr:DUF969 domain-containing protein [Selenomonas sp. oral taxon 136]AME03770.1 hypothetical protein AXE86_06665 [Selenomonas sp. oral taxon 136]
MLVLSGILVMVLGLALRFNALLVVIVAGFVTGLAAGMSLQEIVTVIGEAFIKNRYMSLFILVLPVIGLSERFGLRERAEFLISKISAATAGRIFMLYMLVRQIMEALGVKVSGHPTFIRPLIAPMGEAAALKGRKASPAILDKIRGYAATAENAGNFFAQNVFIAAGGLLLIKGVLEEHGYEADLVTMAVYCIPTAVVAFLFTAVRFHLFDRRIEREIQAFNEVKKD